MSIGDSDKLKVFLDNNPKVPRENMFVDGYAFDAYKAVGFKSFTEKSEAEKEALKDYKMTAPNLSFGEWMKYFGNVGRLSPVEKGMKFGEFPEGVLRLGGTFVVNGNDVIYQWSDRIPGDHPDIGAVLEVAKQAAQKDASPVNT